MRRYISTTPRSHNSVKYLGGSYGDRGTRSNRVSSSLKKFWKRLFGSTEREQEQTEKINIELDLKKQLGELNKHGGLNDLRQIKRSDPILIVKSNRSRHPLWQ